MALVSPTVKEMDQRANEFDKREGPQHNSLVPDQSASLME